MHEEPVRRHEVRSINDKKKEIRNIGKLIDLHRMFIHRGTRLEGLSVGKRG